MVLINRFLPNPVGSDADGEWFEIINNGDSAVSLHNWQIKDEGGKAFTFKNLNLKSDEAATFDYRTTRIALNNNGEYLYLYNDKGELVSELGFSGIVGEGEIITRETLKSATPSFPDNLNLQTSIPNYQIFVVSLGSSLLLASAIFFIIRKIYANFFEQLGDGDESLGGKNI